MRNSLSWRDDVYFRFNLNAVSREFRIAIEELQDFQLAVISRKPINLEMALMTMGNWRVYPTYLKNINPLLETLETVLPKSFWREPPSLTVRGKKFNFEGPKIMSIINMTPDSFYPGSRYDKGKVDEMLSLLPSTGIDIVDIGGESTRPGSDPVTEEEELVRVKGTVEKALSAGLIVSVDTYRPNVAKECLEMGAHIINDVTGLKNKEMAILSKKYDAPLILMHSLGDFKHMQQSPSYENTVNEIIHFFYEKIRTARKFGIENNIVLDPGIGFGKRLTDNLDIINNLGDFKLGHPLMIGLSRKSFIGSIMEEEVEQRGLSTLIFNTLALERGADIVRVHDTVENMKLIKIIKKLKENQR